MANVNTQPLEDDTKIIHAPQDANYYSDFLSEIPANCINDKGKTGCGGTTLAITNSVPTIIAMPFRNLVYNKVSQHPNLLGVTGDTIQEEIIRYARETDCLKIAVTYDSLPKVIEALNHAGIEIFKDVFLLVDEEHILTNQYAFRNKAIKELLEISKQFERRTFMTATPIDREFLLKELEGLPLVKVKWQKVQPVNIVPLKTNNPLNTVCNLVVRAMKGEVEGNLHFFANSVKFSADVIAATGLAPEQVRLVCAENIGNKVKLGKEYPIERADTPVKKINFYTSTAFEGCDIYDENGKTYIVSDGNKTHTLLDISTMFIQIAGRIRNSIYAGEVVHIFNETRYSCNVTLEEYRETTQAEWEYSREYVAYINNAPENIKSKLIEDLKGNCNEKYIAFEDGNMVIDENLYKLDIRNFKITNQIYNTATTLQIEYRERGLQVQPLLEDFSEKQTGNKNTKTNFKGLFEEYAEVYEKEKGIISLADFPVTRYSIIAHQNPLVKESYDKLGVEKVRELKHNVTNVKREIIKLQPLSESKKIMDMLKAQNVCEGRSIPVKSAKAILQEIYDSLGIRAAAKATDIAKWFAVKKRTAKVEGKSVDYLDIIREQTIY